GKEDFTPANRLELFSKIKNNNWDCIILTHDQFAKIPQSDETRRDIMEQELMDVERCLRALEESTMRWRSGKMQQGLEKRQENLTVELNRLEASIEKHKDDSIDFHSMGIDHIFVDECHMFKNLMFQTRHTRVAGIGNTKGSQRALNLLVAIRDIQKRTGKDLGATFLSGTVVVNALTELYVLFKYLRPKELAKQKVSCFDAWAAIFTKKSTDYELSVTGSIKRKERFRTYIKVPELSAFLREITDYRTAEMMQLDVPDKNVQFLSNKPTIEQEDMIMHLVAFANSGEWDDLGLDTLPPDNLEKAKMLIATDIARKMALDMRLLGEKFSDDRENKASRCAQVIYENYIRTAENKGTQFVFSDLSTYKPHEWNIYQDIKDKLVALGIPANEIQFVHTFKTERARKRMIEEMNEGTIRVLFGSTSMLGTGVNAQQRAVAVHHLDIPWRPADLEQRNGRAVRKGNGVKLWGNNKVDVFIYGTEKTLDAYKFNLLKNKQMFINQINNGTISVRRIDEDSMDENNGMNFAEFVAILSGNTDLLDKAKLDNKIMQLTKEQTLFNKERYSAERKIEQNRQD
ncbi:MAG: DNA methylase, partial [Bacteroidaceae bacterium]|nr:DNA methylase [Bacteroidaceae bacterium]